MRCNAMTQREQRVPLLSPLTGAVPKVDGLREPRATACELAEVDEQPARLGQRERAHPPVARSACEFLRPEEGGQRAIVAAAREAFRDRDRGEVGRAAGHRGELRAAGDVARGASESPVGAHARPPPM